MFTNRNIISLILVVAVVTFVQCGAFQQKQTQKQQKLSVIPTTTILAAAVGKDTSSSSSASSASKRQSYEEIISTHDNHNHNNNVINNAIDKCSAADAGSSSSVLTTRRNAMSSVVSSSVSLSLLTASCLPLREAFASDEETLATTSSSIVATATTTTSSSSSVQSQQPFTVIFTVQVDSNKKDELSELEIEVRPDWAPLAADRFKQLIELGFYKDCPFFRVLPGYVAQFGISADPNFNKQWMYCDTPTADTAAIKLCKQPLPDEPRKQPNKRGTLSFASSGKNSRRTQIFINLGNNDGPPNFLDAQNFAPFARIVSSSSSDDDNNNNNNNNNIVKKLNGEYGGKVNQGKAAYYGAEYFEAVFPRLSIIRDAKII